MIKSTDSALCMYDVAKDIIFHREMQILIRMKRREMIEYIRREYPEIQTFNKTRYELLKAVADNYI